MRVHTTSFLSSHLSLDRGSHVPAAVKGAAMDQGTDLSADSDCTSFGYAPRTGMLGSILVWFWYQGDAGLIKGVQRWSPLFNIWKSFRRIGIHSSFSVW